ncbi:PQQ-binding-like beta-propeller repeat protein [Halorubrum sp. LN27]|uniref:outer membrane protein assembly factor BamB family protein n=1 Tax=Halorubrum sp. LN27 TaxID=2801032 RepID=UPI00190E3EE7|nr:PQQ-binding-like beta-propeller repeat protein [Halorubrum sp. LN27]
MQGSSGRRDWLRLSALGIAGLGGCLGELREIGVPSDPSPTTGEDATDESEGDADGSNETAAEDDGADPETREISGPSSVDHAFVDSRNSMAQREATAPESAPIVDWDADVSDLNTRIFTTPVAGEETVVISPLTDVVAYARETGEVRWRLSESAVDSYRTVASVFHRDGNVLFAGVNDRTRGWELVAVDAATGTEAWTVELPTEETESVRTMIVAGDRAIAVTSSDDSESPRTDLIAVDLSGRSVSWTARLGRSRLNPEDLAVSGETLVVTTDEAAADVDNVVAFDLAERERLWSRRLRIGEAIPVVGDGRLYLPTDRPADESGFEGIRSLSLADGSESWRFEFQNPPRTGVTVDGDRVFAVGGGSLYAIDASSGEALWSYAPDGDPRIAGGSSTLPIATRNHLLLGSRYGDNGRIRAVEKATGELAWSVELSEETAYSPFVVGDHLYAFAFDRAGDDGTLYSLH